MPGGAGRIDKTGNTGVYRVPVPHPAGDAPDSPDACVGPRRTCGIDRPARCNKNRRDKYRDIDYCQSLRQPLQSP
jgi:hypothetical protein